MTPELQAMLLTVGGILGFVGKRVPWINNNAIPFVILAWHYVGALLAGAGVIPGGVSGASADGHMASFITVGFFSTVFNPFREAFVNTAINVFLHQLQKSARRLPWQYVASGSAAKK